MSLSYRKKSLDFYSKSMDWFLYNRDLRHERVNANESFLYPLETSENKKYNCSGPPAFKSQRVGYQSDYKLLHHCQHSNNQLNSYIHS